MEWNGERVTLGGGSGDTHPLDEAVERLVELSSAGPHRLLRTAIAHRLGPLSFPAHVWRLWLPGELVPVGEHLQLSSPGEALPAPTGTSSLARHLLGDSPLSSPASPSVVVLSGRDVGRRLFLGRSGAVLGRGRGATLSLADETLSRAHLGFHLRAGEWWVEDLGGPNGLFVEGRRWKTCALRDGAVLDLGRVWLRYEAPSRDAAPVPAAGLSVSPPALSPSPAAKPAGEAPMTTGVVDPGHAAGWLRALVGLAGAAALVGAAWL